MMLSHLDLFYFRGCSRSSHFGSEVVCYLTLLYFMHVVWNLKI